MAIGLFILRIMEDELLHILSIFEYRKSVPLSGCKALQGYEM
jgi:hypothetical protein